MNTLSLARISLLRQHGLLPPASDTEMLARLWDTRGDLLSLLLETGSCALDSRQPRSHRRRIERRVAWLETQLQRHAELTWGLPGGTPDLVSSWVGERIIWWPRGIPPGRRMSFVSSRLGRPLEKYHSWFAVLRRFCQSLDPDHEILTSAPATAAAPFLDRCRELFRVPLLEFVPPRDSHTTAGQWLDECVRGNLPPPASSRLHWPAIVSPALASGTSDPSPLRDRLVVAAADTIVAGKVRAGGHIEHLLRRRLEEGEMDTDVRVLLAIGVDLVPQRAADALRALGAAPLYLDHDSLPATRALTPNDTGIHRAAGTIVSLDQISTADYLTHCTRNAMGPWPDQSMDDYRDALILARADADHSALATLSRIVEQHRLLGSGKAIRGGYGVVCFTAVDLQKIRQLSTFRVHRGRWDFAPYGICIKTRWLQQHAVCPVRYGDEALWQQLPESERPFYQRRLAGRRGQIDWSVEREWRHVGELDLSDLPANEAFLFVPTAGEAKRLAASSRWPVVVLP